MYIFFQDIFRSILFRRNEISVLVIYRTVNEKPQTVIADSAIKILFIWTIRLCHYSQDWRATGTCPGEVLWSSLLWLCHCAEYLRIKPYLYSTTYFKLRHY